MFLAGCLGGLFLAAPLLRAQNPDELLAIRFPARQGYITWPAAPPFPSGRIAASSDDISQTVALRPSRAARGGDSSFCPQDDRCHRRAPLAKQVRENSSSTRVFVRRLRGIP
jgi:hypothetical protein